VYSYNRITECKPKSIERRGTIYRNEGQNRMKDRSKQLQARKKAIQEDILRYGGDILNSSAMQRAFTQKHHTLSTVGAHSMRVATRSLAICHALKKLHIQTDIPSVVTGSLCHDLGILGRDEKYRSSRECSRQHPLDSVEIANALTGGVTDKTADIISRHMWPVGKAKPPNSLEAAIVSAADKIATVEDFVKEYEEKRPGLRGVVREIRVNKKEGATWNRKKK